MLLHQRTLENMLTATKPPWPWLKQMAMKWFSAVLVTTVSTHACWKVLKLHHTGHPNASYIYDFSYKMAHLVTMDPNLEDWKSLSKSDMKNAAKTVRRRSSKMKRVSAAPPLQQYAITRKLSPWLHTVYSQPTLALNPLLTHSHYFLGYKVISVFYSLNITRQRFLT